MIAPKSKEEVIREKQVRELRKEQIMGAFFMGIGTAVGITVGGMVLSGFIKVLTLI